MTTHLYTGESMDDLLASSDLRWIAAKQGFYLQRQTLLGQVVIPTAKSDLPAFPNENGFLKYTFDKLPAPIIAKAYDFFARTFKDHHSEAEVLLTYNPTVTEDPLRIFVPAQEVSAASVHSAFNPEHLARGWQVIGSIHSHCDFSAFHSGTDTSDANDFDGLHITIGHVNSNNPSFDVMVMINKVRWNFKIDDIADLSELHDHPAPKWWDRYILKADRNPTINDMFHKYQDTSKKRSRWNGTSLVTPYRPTYHGSYQSKSYPTHWGWEFDDWATDYPSPSNTKHVPPPTPIKPNYKGYTKTIANKVANFLDAFRSLYDEAIYPCDLLSEEEIFGPDDDFDIPSATPITIEEFLNDNDS